MNTDQFLIRKAVAMDCESIFDLYNLVSKKNGGLSRTENEITNDYVKNFVEKSVQNVSQFATFDKLHNEKIIAKIHCYKLEPRVFEHILNELTILVDTELQGKGLGKKLSQTVLNYIKENRNDILGLN